MKELKTNTATQLPATIPELSRFVMVGRDKLQAVKAEIHAIEKVGLAQEVREQKLQEAQEIAEVVTDAEVRIGELLKQIPKASGGDRKSDSFKNSPHVDFDSQKPKSQVIKENGLTQRQAEHFQIMADNPDSVAKAKEKARKDGEVLSRSAVLKQIVSDCTKQKDSKKRVTDNIKVRSKFSKTKSHSEYSYIGFYLYSDIYNGVTTINASTSVKGTDFDANAILQYADGKQIESLIKQIEECEERLSHIKNALRKGKGYTI